MIEINQPAPDLSYVTTSNQKGQLSDHQGQPLILFFYPKDATPGCTQENKDFAALYAQFQKKNAVIMGVSRDSMASHEKFKSKHHLPYELISDTDGKLCEAFAVVKPKSMFGKTFLGIERSTFLINADGQIQHIWRKVKVCGHAQAVLDMLS